MLYSLSEIRRKKKMTQAELGQMVGVSQRAIAAYESGERKPSPKVANRLISVLEIPMDTAWKILYNNDEDRCDPS